MQEYIYKKMYLRMFNTVTTVLRDFTGDPEAAFLLLRAAQIECEGMYIKAKDKKHIFSFQKNSPE